MDSYTMDSGRGTSISLAYVAAPGTAVGWTDMPAAVTEFVGGNTRRFSVDLSRCRKFKINVEEGSPLGIAAAKLGLQYSTDAGSTWKSLDGDVLDAQSLAFLTGLSTTGFKNSPEGTITPAARGQVLIRIIGSDGDGVADPTFRNGLIMFYP
jgi:hypothetical protein